MGNHGMSKSPEYNSWRAMMGRCYYPSYKGYAYCGSRGVIVCERWHTFANFFEDMGARPAGTTLDRIDGDGNYEPGNCRWADLPTQNRNRRPWKWSHNKKEQIVGVNLSKGGNVSLTKEAPGATKYVVGLGWDPRTTDGKDFDLDASAIAVKADGQVLSDQHFVFFNNLKSPEEAIVHTGDNLTGAGEGDDEQIIVDTTKLPAEVDKIVFPVTIFEADTRSQNFGQVSKAHIRVMDEGGTEITKYDLSEDASTETAMTFGELYRNGDEWKFRAVGSGSSAGLSGIASGYGVKV